VLFGTILPYLESQVPGIQEEPLAHFAAALRELRQASHHAHHAVAKTPEIRTTVACLMMPNQSLVVIRMRASLFLPAQGTLLFSDQEMCLFVDQGMDMELAKH
jgi:hypothetical protein